MTQEPKFSKGKKLGKNKKKSWRGIDITATEEFLEDQRFQLRTTGLVAEKANNELFAVERSAKDKSSETTAPRSRRKGKTELKCYSSLVNSSRIQCPRTDYPVSNKFEAKAEHREVVSRRAVKRNTVSHKVDSTTQQSNTVKDLWGDEKPEAEANEHFMQVTKRTRVQPPKQIKRKGSARPAIEVPHPGASVNPAYDDHQDLMLQAVMVEMKKEKAERKIFNALDGKFPRASEAPTEATWMEEMSGGLFDTEHPEEEEDVDDDKHISVNPPVSREKKKLPQQRKKQKEAKLLDYKLKQQKKVKNLEQKVFSLARMRSEIAREARQRKKKAELKAKLLVNKKYDPKKLGKTKVEEPELELKLSHELVGNLRSVKPEGHLLEDRYRSLQMRNLVEPRAKVNKKKTKTKSFEKKSFREVTA